MDAHQNPDGTQASAAASHPEFRPDGAAVLRPRWLRRVLLVASGVCAFALVGSLISPSWSNAGDDRVIRVNGGGSGVRQRSIPLVQGPNLIGTLEGNEYRILIHHADDAPRYSVCAPDGRVLRDHLLAEDVYREFPTLDLKRLRLDPPLDSTSGPLMLVYPLD